MKVKNSKHLRSSNNGKFVWLCLFLATILFPKNAFSQPKSMADSVYSIDEVLVRSKHQQTKIMKIDVPMKYIPISISSISKNIFEQRGIDNVNDALKNVTGVKPVVTYGGFQTFYMRGFGSPVLMLDGQRDERMNYSSSAPVPDLTSVESLELLKGPASVMYGHSAVGGILNIVRKAPTETFHTNASISYGTWNSKRATFGSGGRLSEKLSYRMDVGISDRDGWRDNHDKRFSSYLALNYKLSTKDKFEFRTGYVNDLYGTEAGIPTVLYDVKNIAGSVVSPKSTIPSTISRDQRFNDPSDFLKNKNYNALLKYGHIFSDNLSISNIFSVNKDDINYFSTETLTYLTSSKPIYSTYYEQGGVKTYICLDSIKRSSPLRFSHMTTTYQNQLEANWTPVIAGLKHTILGGWSMMYLDRTSYTGYNDGDVSGPGYLATVSSVNPVLNQGAIITRFSKANPRRDLTNGFYAQDLIGVSDKFKVLLAARLDFFKFQAAGSVNTIDGQREYLRSGLNWSTSHNTSFTYKIGGVYLPVENFSLYGSFGTFFKPYRDIYNSTYIYVNKDGEVFVPVNGKEIFKPESGYQAEGGFRYNYNKYIRITASAFYIHKENIRENVANVKVDENGTQVTKKVYAQIGVVNSKGFDVEAQVNPVKSLTLAGGYTFTDAEYGDFKSNPYVQGDTRKGNYQVYSPKHLLYASSTYRFYEGALKNLAVGLACNSSSKSYTNATNTIFLPSYFVADANVSYSFKTGLRLGIVLKNIADKTYYEWALNNSQFIPSEGRSCLATLSYSL